MNPHRLTLRLTNRLAEIPRSAESVESFLSGLGIPSLAINRVNLCLEELLANTISYGYDDAVPHEIEVQLQWDGDILVIDLADDGRAFDPTLAPAPNLDAELEDRPIGGLGIHLVRTLMDRVAYRYDQGRNLVRLSKRLSPTPPDPAGEAPGT